MGLGLVAPFRGALFVAKRRMWSPIVWPTALATLLSCALAVALVRWVRDHVDALAHPGLISATLGGLGFLLVAALAFLVLQPLVAAPFTDHLTELVERAVSGEAPRPSLWRSTAQSVAHGALKSACYLVALAVTNVLGLATGAGGAIGIALLIVFLAYDGFDYPLARRGVSFSGKWGFLASHPGLALGYGASALLIQLIPLAFLVTPATSAAGATIAFLELGAGVPRSA